MRTKTKQVKEGMDCAECGQHVEPAGAFHPYLYCVLFKNGYGNQEVVLRNSGFVRTIEVDTQRARADGAEKERDAALASLRALRASEPAE